MSKTRLFAEALLVFAECERQIEVLRQLLCENPNFHPYMAFKMIDRGMGSNKGFITSEDLQVFLESNGFRNTRAQCFSFIHNYDIDRDGRLQYSEFLRSVLPLNNPELRQEVSLRSPLSGVNLDKQSQYTLAKLITEDILISEEIQLQVLILNKQPDFDSATLFLQLDRNKHDRILPRDLDNFFYQLNMEVSQDQVASIFRRIDFNNDGYIDYEEFTRIFGMSQPTSPRFSDQKPQTSSQIIRTPQKSLIYESRLQTTNDQNQSLHKDYKDDFTMSNLLTASKQNRNTNIVSQSPLKYDQMYPTNRKDPQQQEPKYLSQKTELRAQLRLSQIQADKKPRMKEKMKSAIRSQNQTPKKSIQIFEKNQTSTKKVRTKKDQVKQQSMKQSPLVTKFSSQFQQQNLEFVFSQILVDIIDKEQSLEQAKIALVHCEDFNLIDAFRLIDRQRNGFITAEQLDYFLDQVPGTMAKLIKNKCSQNQIRFSEFIKLLEPSNSKHAEFLHRKTPKSKEYTIKVQFLNSQTITLLKQVIFQLLDLVNMMDKIRLHLKRNVKWEPREAFYMLDKYTQDSFLTPEDFQHFLIDQKVQFTPSDIELLVKNFDLDQDGQVSYNDFNLNLSK